MNNLNEGWGYPSVWSNKEHYFLDGQVKSLCGRRNWEHEFPRDHTGWEGDERTECCECIRRMNKLGLVKE